MAPRGWKRRSPKTAVSWNRFWLPSTFFWPRVLTGRLPRNDWRRPTCSLR